MDAFETVLAENIAVYAADGGRAARLHRVGGIEHGVRRIERDEGLDIAGIGGFHPRVVQDLASLFLGAGGQSGGTMIARTSASVERARNIVHSSGKQW